MLRTTVGRMLVDRALPEELRRPDRVLDAAGIKALFQEVAEKYPDRYREIARDLTQLGHEIAYSKGGLSFGISHLRASRALKARRAEIERGIDAILRDPALSDDEREKRIVSLAQEHRKPLEDEVYEESLGENNPLALQIKSGVRGNRTNLRSLRGADLLYVDHRDRPIPIPVLKSYTEGLSPAEYWAGAYGARRGVVDLKQGTAKAGYLCLARGTPVRMVDGSIKAIEDVRAGDMVFGVDIKPSGSSRLPRWRPVRVLAAVANGPRACRRYRYLYDAPNLRFELQLACSPDHRLLVDRFGDAYSMEPAGAGFSCLAVAVVRMPGTGRDAVLALRRAPWAEAGEDLGLVQTFDIEIDHPDHAFLLANGLVVSNSKVLNQAAHRLVVSALDADSDDEGAEDRGLPVDVEDNDNAGALLARGAGGYARNTVLTPRILKHLRDQDIREVLVRSPLVGGPPQGGVYARDVGVREKGRLAPIGDFVGLGAAQALCLAAGTEVRMANGSIRAIEEIEPGDIVLGCSSAGVTRPTRVIRVYANGDRECWRTIFRRGTGASRRENMLELVSTLEHKMLTVVHGTKNPRPSAEVRAVRRPENRNQRYYAKGPTAFDDSGLTAEPRALLLGLIIGDGCYTGAVTSNGVTFYCWDSQLLADTADYMSGLGLSFVLTCTTGQYRVVDKNRHNMRRTPGGHWVRNDLRGYLLDHGLWGQGSKTKVLPATVWQWDNASVAALLSGLFAADGHICRTRRGRFEVGYASSSRELIEAVRYLLAVRFGVYATAVRGRVKKRPDGKGLYDPNYCFTVAGQDSVRRLAAVLNIPGCKRARLARAVAEWPRAINAAEAGRFAFVSQTRVGILPTYDIEVEHPDHLFVLANNLIVSNSEKTIQASISSKHAGGVAGSTGASSGYKAIEKLVNPPKVYEGAATHSQLDGRVDAVEDAPQGGWYVAVGGKKHYVPPEGEVRVKPGDSVEAGDVLSSGIPNPAEIVRHKGIGEGRRYFMHTFRDVYRNTGLGVHRRNIELLARGLIDHVEATEEFGSHVAGDVIPYSAVERDWVPRVGTEDVRPSSAVGRYLEAPALHYTIGTRITPSVAGRLAGFGIERIRAHREPPPFRPEMLRGMTALQHDPDWATRHYGSGLRKGLLSAAQRGSVADPRGSSFVSSLMLDPVSFGQEGLTAGWDADEADDD